MRNILVTLLLCAGLFVSCASPGFGPNGGLFSSTTTGVHGATNGAGAKVGQACASSILGFIGIGGDTVGNIASSAGITNIKSERIQPLSATYEARFQKISVGVLNPNFFLGLLFISFSTLSMSF